MKKKANILTCVVQENIDEFADVNKISKCNVIYYNNEIIIQISLFNDKCNKNNLVNAYLNSIFNKVCYILNVNEYDAKSKSRKSEYVEARHIYFLIALKEWDREKQENEKHKANKAQIARYLKQTHGNIINSTNRRVKCQSDMKRFNEVFSKYVKL